MYDQANTQAGAPNVANKQIERVDLFNAVEELTRRLSVACNRLESINNRVNGYGPEDPSSVSPVPSSLRDKLQAMCPIVGEIEHLISRIDSGIGGDMPKQTALR